jgi:nucleoside 2-deoxyribosyltransferase
MSKIFVYLAGPISGCTEGEANDWRTSMALNLGNNIVGVSPLRCEPIIGEIYGKEYDNNQFGTPAVIAAKNKEDVRRCDVTFAYLPAGGLLSVGTLQEIGWACGMGKPVILVTDNEHVLTNAVIKATVPWRFTEAEGGFAKAVEVIQGVFRVYTH